MSAQSNPERGPLQLTRILYPSNCFFGGEIKPGFGQLVFCKEELSGVSFLQETDKQGMIQRFIAVDIPLDRLHSEGIQLVDDRVMRQAGEPGIFAFRSLSRTIMGPKTEVQQELRKELDHLRDYSGFPFLLWSISGFLDDRDLNAQAQQLIIEDHAIRFPRREVVFTFDQDGMISSVGMRPQ